MSTTPGETDWCGYDAAARMQGGSQEAHGAHSSLRWRQGEDVPPFFLSNAAAVDLCSSILDGTIVDASQEEPLKVPKAWFVQPLRAQMRSEVRPCTAKTRRKQLTIQSIILFWPAMIPLKRVGEPRMLKVGGRLRAGPRWAAAAAVSGAGP